MATDRDDVFEDDPGIGAVLKEIWDNVKERTSDRLNIKPLLAELHRMDEKSAQERAELLAKVQHVADAIDKRDKEHNTMNAAGKQAVKLFLSKIGWL